MIVHAGRIIQAGLCAALGLTAGTVDVAAQADTAARLHGQAYDSLIRGPLAGATVWLRDVNRSAFTDAKGRFDLEHVPPGAHVVILSDAELEDIGVPDLATVITVAPGESREITLAIPSLGTLWRRLCAGALPGRDSAIVFGTVRDADTDSLLAGASVTARWMGFAPGDSQRVRIAELTATSESDSTGSYRICGVRLGSAAHLQARAGIGVSGEIGVPAEERPIIRSDFRVGRGAMPVTDSTAGPATLRGLVKTSDGRPIAGAQVDIGKARSTVTGRDGQFIISGLPVGTQWLRVLAVGYVAVERAVDLLRSDTANVVIDLRPVVLLDTLAVRGQTRATRERAAFEERRKTGLGYALTEEEIKRHPSVRTLFQAIPSVTVTGHSEREFTVLLPISGSLGRGSCVAHAYLDGIRSDFEEIGSLSLDDIQAIEVYPRVAEVPAEYINVANSCGVVLVWTKRMR